LFLILESKTKVIIADVFFFGGGAKKADIVKKWARFLVRPHSKVAKICIFFATSVCLSTSTSSITAGHIFSWRALPTFLDTSYFLLKWNNS